MIATEAMALSMLGKRLPLGQVWRPALIANAFANSVRFSFGAAPAVRARLYRQTLNPAEVAAVSAITDVSVTAMALAAAGAGLLIAGPELAARSLGPPLLWRMAGLALLAPALAWLALSAMRPVKAQVGGVEARTPGAGGAALQILSGVGDWAAAAGLLYLLLPEHGGWSYPAFLAVYACASLLGAVSGSPAGLGVFEAAILVLSPTAAPVAETVAALVAYRLLYTLAPLTVAGVLLGADIIDAAEHPAARAARRLGDAAVELAPPVFAALAFASGVILMLSSAMPSLHARLRFLTELTPLFVVEISHFMASIIAVLLLVVAAALWRKLEGAYVAALALLGLGALFALLKGLDVEETAILGFVALALAPCRRAFTRKSRLLSEPLSGPWLAAVLGAAIAAAWLGLFAYRRVDYSNDLWWTFLRDAQASRFLRGAAGAGLVVALVSAWSLLAPGRIRWRGRPSPADVERAAAAMAHAEDMRGAAHLALLADKDLMFSPSGDSFIMFRARGGHWIAMSEPCGQKCERRALLWRFVEMADEAGASPVFYSVTDAMLPELAELGLAIRKIGETAMVPIQGFSLQGRARNNLRNTCNRAEREGASFELLPAGSADAHAAELRAVSDAWLKVRSGAEKAFSLGRFDLHYLDRAPIAVVRAEGRIVAFANVWTTPDGKELSVDLMRYGTDGPPGVMDYLVVQLIEWGKANGCETLDLGMAPLAGLDAHRMAPILSRLGAAVFAEGEAVYGFRGLRAYKDKFDPDWRPLYLAARPGVMTPFALMDVALLTSGGWKGLFERG